MPLDKSPTDAARSKNIATEMKAGKPPAQAQAIGYAMQREARGEKGGNASGAGREGRRK